MQKRGNTHRHGLAWFQEVTALQHVRLAWRVPFVEHQLRGPFRMLLQQLGNLLVFRGPAAISWPGTDRNGAPAGNGLYFARARMDGGKVTRKFVMTR